MLMVNDVLNYEMQAASSTGCNIRQHLDYLFQVIQWHFGQCIQFIFCIFATSSMELLPPPGVRFTQGQQSSVIFMTGALGALLMW